MKSNSILIFLVLIATSALLAAQPSSTAQNPLRRQYHDGETLIYNMTGLNESWHCTVQADGIVKKDASGAYFGNINGRISSPTASPHRFRPEATHFANAFRSIPIKT